MSEREAPVLSSQEMSCHNIMNIYFFCQFAKGFLLILVKSKIWFIAGLVMTQKYVALP